MERNLLIGGFGGQGVMVMGRLLSYATCYSTDKFVTFFPSYGAEQRGGTANCYVVISDEEIGEPVGSAMDDLVVMNGPSLEKFLPLLKEGGTLFVNSSIVTEPIEREDITVVSAPVTEMALELGNAKVLNVIMLGVYIGYTGILPEDIVWDMVMKQLGKKEKLIPLNKAAYAKGLEIGKKAATQAVPEKLPKLGKC